MGRAMPGIKTSNIVKSFVEWIFDIINIIWYNKFVILFLALILIVSIEVHVHLSLVLYWVNIFIIPILVVVNGVILAVDILVVAWDALITALSYIPLVHIKRPSGLTGGFADNLVSVSQARALLHEMQSCATSDYHTTDTILTTTLKDTTGSYLCGLCRYIYPTDVGQLFKIKRSFLWDGSCEPMTATSGPDQNCPHMDTQFALLCAAINIYAFIIIFYVVLFIILCMLVNKNFWGFLISVYKTTKIVVNDLLSR